MLLRVVGGWCAKFETGQTFSYLQTDVTTPNIVGSCWSTMLRPFPPGFRLRSHGTGRFSTGWKIWSDTSFHMEPFNIFSLFTRNCRTRLNFNFCQRFYHLPMRRELLTQSKMASPSWVTTHPCNRVFTVQKVSRPQCSYLPFKFSTVQVKDLTLDFSVQIFERSGVQIFVRFEWFRVNGTPKRRNFRPVENSTGTVWT